MAILDPAIFEYRFDDFNYGWRSRLYMLEFLLRAYKFSVVNTKKWSRDIGKAIQWGLRAVAAARRGDYHELRGTLDRIRQPRMGGLPIWRDMMMNGIVFDQPIDDDVREFWRLFIDKSRPGVRELEAAARWADWRCPDNERIESSKLYEAFEGMVGAGFYAMAYSLIETCPGAPFDNDKS